MGKIACSFSNSLIAWVNVFFGTLSESHLESQLSPILSKCAGRCEGMGLRVLLHLPNVLEH